MHTRKFAPVLDWYSQFEPNMDAFISATKVGNVVQCNGKLARLKSNIGKPGCSLKFQTKCSSKIKSSWKLVMTSSSWHHNWIVNRRIEQFPLCSMKTIAALKSFFDGRLSTWYSVEWNDSNRLKPFSGLFGSEFWSNKSYHMDHCLADFYTYSDFDYIIMCI